MTGWVASAGILGVAVGFAAEDTPAIEILFPQRVVHLPERAP